MPDVKPPRWAIDLAGEAFDLEDWEQNLKPPFDPWVERSDKFTILHWAGFNDAESVDEVYEMARPVVDQLNGALWIANKTRPLRVGGVAEYDANGTRQTIIRAMVGRAEMRLKATGHAAALNAAGTVIPPPPPQPSEVQEWFRLSENNELLADALIYFSRAEWFDIYKAIECLEDFVGSQAALEKLAWIGAFEFKNMKRSANSFRHRGKHKAPQKLMPLKDARQLLGTMIREAFKRVKT